MPDVYGVVAADVAAELPGLFPQGFTPSTVPPLSRVTTWITVADTVASLKVQDAAGTTPQTTDKAAALAKEYVIAYTRAKVLAAVYAGKDPTVYAQTLRDAFGAAGDILKALEALGVQAVGTGTAEVRTGFSPTIETRALMITDADLDADSGLRDRW